ncbi:AIPR family protein [Curtobacterium sp. MCBD17_003]|uniref:AIPR family protein n=1 Tax=Curtobacterium sp. MCBD17_003 TaxID=2175667 RepID=UPI0015E89FBB|nr:AIPR family protein [Curtobacterium sp. MCBD17_003]WIE53187.1 AIPR family protein [Curtobacterium sp. MCBD17_003]
MTQADSTPSASPEPTQSDEGQARVSELAAQLAASRPAFAAYNAREDLHIHDPNALLLFVAELRLGIDDVDAFAANALTDHSNDKKCDMVALTADRSKIIVAQGYEALTEKPAGPANKASDMNTAVSWLLTGPLDAVPEKLRSAAAEVRSALEDGQVSEFEIWFVHNLPSSTNVENELKQAAKSASSAIAQYFPDATVDVRHLEIGRDQIDKDYEQSNAPILVSEERTFEIPGGFEIGGVGWKAYSTATKLEDLRSLWTSHGVQLMSPNVRDYLGVVKKSGNINYGIKETAKSEPKNFAIYNNGITVLTNGYRVNDDEGSIVATGIGIVNGGQTTGAVGEMPAADVEELADARVMARFVTCTDPTVLDSIVRFNNTQNKVEATDFRSGDAVQTRLRQEFAAIPDADYRGGRRGGATDAISRSRQMLSDSSVAQSLAAFHGNPNLAYNDTRMIWDSDGTYASVFRETLTANHVVFVQSLLAAVDDTKRRLAKIPDSDRTETQRRHAQFFSTRGSNLLLVSAVSASLETIVGRPVPDSYSLRFSRKVSPASSAANWKPIVDVLLSFTAQLVTATDQGLKSREKVNSALTNFTAMVEAVRGANAEAFDLFGAKVEWDGKGDGAVSSVE